MKKSLLVIVMLSSMVLAACGGDDTDTKKAENNGTPNNSRTNNGQPTNNANNGSNNTTVVPTNNTTATTGSNNSTGMTTTGPTTPPAGCVESTVVGPCDALCQTGCAAMQTCVAGVFMQDGTAEELCQPVGAGTQGVACDQNSGCAEGLGCIGGVCNKYCRLEGGMPSCEAGDVCIPGIAQGANIGFCRAGCTFFPDSCGDTENCAQISATEATCIPAGAKAVGETCTSPRDCAKGAGCIGPQGAATCRTICDTANPTQCTDPETCMMLAGALFGACIAP